jgi:hypothetical protein
VVAVDELDPGGEDKVGSRYTIKWRSRLPYPLRFEFRTERVEGPRLMEGRADGELHGTGRWRLFEQDGVTAVLYEWDVETTSAWMNLMGPIARPVFKWNHDVVMRWGGRRPGPPHRSAAAGRRLRRSERCHRTQEVVGSSPTSSARRTPAHAWVLCLSGVGAACESLCSAPFGPVFGPISSRNDPTCAGIPAQSLAGLGAPARALRRPRRDRRLNVVAADQELIESSPTWSRSRRLSTRA